MNKPTIVMIIIFAAFLAIVSPLVFIWSLNTLFGLSIAYGFFEWLAALVILGVLRGDSVSFKKE
jgi:EamA domain-containing membrane protein RarD